MWQSSVLQWYFDFELCKAFSFGFTSREIVPSEEKEQVTRLIKLKHTPGTIKEGYLPVVFATILTLYLNQERYLGIETIFESTTYICNCNLYH